MWHEKGKEKFSGEKLPLKTLLRRSNTPETKVTIFLEYPVVLYSLLTDELAIFVMPEVQTLGMGSSETFYGGHTSQFHAHQLVSYPESGREVNI